MLKKYLLIALGCLAAIILIFVIVVAMQPNDMNVVRSQLISADAAEIFPRVNDLHAFTTWSPYEDRDPNLKRTFEGPSAGEGAIYRWSGNDDVGEGSMKILESRSPEKIRIELIFIRPFAGNNEVTFKFEPVGEQTKVSWQLAGKHNFMSKTMCLFMDFDKMCGTDFEKGLAKLKQQVEAGSEQAVEPAAGSPTS